MPLKLKIDENEQIEIRNNKPVYIDDDGKEVEVDANQLFDKVKELNGEAKQRRIESQELKNKFSIFDDVENVTEWKEGADKAIELSKNIDESTLIQAGKVDEVKANMKIAHDEEKANMKKSFDVELADLRSSLTQKDGTIFSLMVTSKFSQSSLFSGSEPKTILPPEIAATYFGHQFKVEKGDDEKLKVVGYTLKGTQIYSRKNPGELADFEEAITEIIDEYPMKDSIMRAGFSGGGGQGGGDATSVSKIEKLRADYAEALKVKNVQLAISLKNKLFIAEQESLARKT